VSRARDVVHPAERVEIVPARPRPETPASTRLAGNVRRCSFLGNILRYAVDLEGAAPITVDLQNAAGVGPLPTGAPVVLRWLVSNSLILPPRLTSKPWPSLSPTPGLFGGHIERPARPHVSC